MRTIANVRVGEPDTTPDSSAHTPGVKQGNKRGSLRSEGIEPGKHGRGAGGTARRSTGINPQARNPIDPRMPNLSPA